MDLQENMNLAAKAFAEGKLQEAHDLFSKCSEQTQNPKAVCVILTNKGATLQRMGKLQDSLVVFAEALEYHLHDFRQPQQESLEIF